MTLVFDTSALSPLLRNDDATVRAATSQEYDRLIVPLAADAELRFGFAYGNRPAENLVHYNSFKQRFNIEVVSPDQDTAIIYADLARWARQHGVALSHNDFWIAATCVQTGGSLLAIDGDFGYLPQVRLAALSI